MTPEELELKKPRKDGSFIPTENGVVAAPNSSRFWNELTLEPAMAGALTALYLTATSQINLYMRTACLQDLRHPQHLCDGGVGEEFRRVELETQEHISAMKAPRGLVLAATITLVLLFALPWSDVSRRRKPLVVLSLLGLGLSSVNALILITFPYLSAGWVMYIVQLPSAMGGDVYLFMVAGFCYISDVCNVTGRDPMIVFSTNRAASQCARILGSIGGPLIYRYLGFYGVYSTALLLQVSSLVFVVWCMRDVDPERERQVSPLDVRLPAAALRSLLVPRRHYRRVCVLMMAFVAMMDSAMLEAEDLLSFMYFRNKFFWDDITFGFYKAFQSAVLFSGTLLTMRPLKERLRMSDKMICVLSDVWVSASNFILISTNATPLEIRLCTLLTMRLLKERLRMSDEMIGVLSGISFAASKLSLIGANTTSLAFLVPIVGLVSAGSLTVQRTVLNKHIDIAEQGKVHSAVGAVDQAFQAIVIPGFPLLYSRTAATAPDAWIGVFALKACLQTVLFVLAYLLHRSQTATESKETTEEAVIENATSLVKEGSDELKNKTIPKARSEEEVTLLAKVLGIRLDHRRENKEETSKGDNDEKINRRAKS